MGKAAAAVGVVGNLFSGLSARAQAEGQAITLSQQARREAEIGKIQAEDFRKSASATAATSRAVAPDRDEDVEAQFADEAELQALRILNNADVTSLRLHQQAEQTRDAGRAALIGSGLTAGARILGSGGGFKKPSTDTPTSGSQNFQTQPNLRFKGRNNTTGSFFSSDLRRR
jgi:hypothetical protein